MRINSVLDGLRDRRLAVIQDEISEIVSWSWVIAVVKVLGANETNKSSVNMPKAYIQTNGHANKHKSNQTDDQTNE